MRKRSSSIHRKTVSILALLLVTVSGAAPAQDRTNAAVQGGPGGTYFEYSCGSGRMLVGLHGSAGVLVDAVQAVCARVDAAGSVSEATPQGPVFGGQRPFDKVADCPDGQAIRMLDISQSEGNPFVGAIRIRCQETARMEEGCSTDLNLSGSGHLRGYDSPFGPMASQDNGEFGASRCPDPTYAVGIRGRSSFWLNALGLICAPKPVTAAAAAAT